MALSFLLRALKTYTARDASVPGVPSCEPFLVVVSVFPRKAPKAEVQVLRSYFSEMRGTGSANGPKVTLTDTAAVSLCREFVADRAGKTLDALLVLADRLDELAATAEKNRAALASVARDIRRLHLLSTLESPSAFVRGERRARAYADCRFKVGDMVRVTRCGMEWITKDGPVPVVGVRFDEGDLSWRIGVRGMEGMQSSFAHAVEALATA